MPDPRAYSAYPLTPTAWVQRYPNSEFDDEFDSDDDSEFDSGDEFDGIGRPADPDNRIPIAWTYRGLHLASSSGAGQGWIRVSWDNYPWSHLILSSNEAGSSISRSRMDLAIETVDRMGGSDGLIDLLRRLFVERPCGCSGSYINVTWQEGAHIVLCDACSPSPEDGCSNCTLSHTTRQRLWEEAGFAGLVPDARSYASPNQQPSVSSPTEEGPAMPQASYPHRLPRPARQGDPPDSWYLTREDFSPDVITGNTEQARYLKIARPIGMEIELVRTVRGIDGIAPLYRLPPDFGIGTDGSLPEFPEGAEFTTPPGYGLEFEDSIRDAYTCFREAGYIEHVRAGLHVHVSVGDKSSPGPRWNVYALVSATQDLIYHLAGSYRAESEYSRPLREGTRFAILMARSKGLVEANDQQYEFRRAPAGGKYYCVNFSAQYPTLEFRAHESTMDAERAMAWASLCQCIVEASFKDDGDWLQHDTIQALAEAESDHRTQFAGLAALVNLPEMAIRKLGPIVYGSGSTSPQFNEWVTLILAEQSRIYQTHQEMVAEAAA